MIKEKTNNCFNLTCLLSRFLHTQQSRQAYAFSFGTGLRRLSKCWADAARLIKSILRGTMINIKNLNGLLLIILLVLRIFVIGVTTFLGISNVIIFGVFEIGTYFIFLLVIIIWKNDLSIYNITYKTLIFVCVVRSIEILIKLLYFPVQESSTMVFAGFKVIITIAIILNIGKYNKHSKTNFTIEIKNIIIALSAAFISLAIGATIILSHNYYMYKNLELPVLKLTGYFIFVFYQMGYAGITEEIVFRGILFGWCKERNIKIWKYQIIQVLLFTISHIYYLKYNPMAFWISVPLIGLILGFVIIKTKNVAYSIITHGIVNGLLERFAIMVANLI